LDNNNEAFSNTSDSLANGIFYRATSSKTLTSTKVTEFADVSKTRHALKILTPHKTDIKVQINREFLKEIKRWEAMFSSIGFAELYHKDLPNTLIQSVDLHDALRGEKIFTCGSIDFEHGSKITLSVFLTERGSQTPKLSGCTAYQCDDVIFNDYDLSILPLVKLKELPQNLTQQLNVCSTERENFKFGFVISAGVAFILLIIAGSLVINAIRVNKTLDKYSAFESTSW